MKKIKIMAALMFGAFSFSIGAEIEGLYKKTLDNGLSVFVMENHAAPLAYVEIAVRAGAVTQKAETAGLFHLYEHLMFKGNEKFKNQVEFTEAMNALGVGQWNGSTGVDRVNYYFTVPSSKVREGIEFWSYAIRTPLLNKDELEREKEVVLSEIEADLTKPGGILSKGISALTSEEPWRKDPSGNPDAVRNATVEQMKQIQKDFYVPENSAILIGGDVRHEEIFKIAQNIFGEWKRAENPPDFEKPQKREQSDDIRLVFADPSSSDSFVQAHYFLRGPDGEYDADDTYAADVWTNLIEDPNGEFSKIFVENENLSIPDSDYVSGGYYTRRASGQISITASMQNDSKMTSVARAEEFRRTIKEKLVREMISKDSPFLSNISAVEQRLKDSQIYEQETAEGVLSSLSFFFSSVDADYFLDYNDALSRVNEDDVRDFVKKYFEGKFGVLLVVVSESEFEKRKGEFLENGYTQITKDNAFWWNNTKQEKN